MDEQRAEFEAWAKDKGYDTAHTYDTERNKWVFFNPMTADLWITWQAATQRQQDRIAELEADIAHKDAYAEQLGRELFKAYAERQELEAQVQALSLDAAMLDWLEAEINEHGAIHLHDGTTPHGHGLGLRPGALCRTLREAIDAAIARATHKEGA